MVPQPGTRDDNHCWEHWRWRCLMLPIPLLKPLHRLSLLPLLRKSWLVKDFVTMLSKLVALIHYYKPLSSKVSFPARSKQKEWEAKVALSYNPGLGSSPSPCPRQRTRQLESWVSPQQLVTLLQELLHPHRIARAPTTTK